MSDFTAGLVAGIWLGCFASMVGAWLRLRNRRRHEPPVSRDGLKRAVTETEQARILLDDPRRKSE